MKYLWQEERASIRNVWEALFPEGEKAYTTVQTYMERMVEKGLLTKEKIGMVNFYSPAVSEEETLARATDSFVKKVFNGSFGLLAAFLVDSDKLDNSDREELRKLIEQHSKE